MDETTAVTTDACWAGQKAVLKDTPWVDQTDASKAECSAARWDNSLVASMDETTAATMDTCWAGQKAVLTDALKAAAMDAT